MSHSRRTPIYPLIAATSLVVSACSMGCVVAWQLLTSNSNSAWALWSAGGGLAMLLLIFSLTGILYRVASNRAPSDQHASEEIRRLAMVAERTTNGVCITDKACKVLWANKGFSRITGYTLEEVLGKVPGHVLQCENTNQTTVEQIRSALRNGHGFHGEILNRDKYGREYWVDLEIQAIRNDEYEITGYMGIQNDITERIEAERSTRELVKVIDEAPHEFFLFDAETLQFVAVNEGACKALGYSEEELLLMSPLDIKPDFNEETFRSKIAPLTSPDSNQNKLGFDTIHRRKDGSVYSAHVSLHLTEYHGCAVYAAFVADVTERQKLEQQLCESRKLESIGQLAAGIAHEINTPIQCVVSNLEYLEETVSKLLDVTDGYHDAMQSSPEDWDSRRRKMQALEEEHGYRELRLNSVEALEESVTSTKRVVEVVRAMKNMSHPGTDEKIWLDVNEMISNAATISRNSWKYHATMDLQLDESIPTIPVLSNQMNQVILNLIVNAADAIVEKHEQQQNPSLGQIQIATWEESNGVKIRIRDTGCGMSPEVKERALDPFFTTKEIGKGTGQGLAISHDIVVCKHQGTIEFESEPGQGTTFTIWLPADLTTEQPTISAEMNNAMSVELAALRNRFEESSSIGGSI